MAEKSHTSSMTSVTEEETMSDSDTTESYTNITSSLLSSTDTDDKLTPKLINISISKSAKQEGNPPKRRKCKNTTEHDSEVARAMGNDFAQQISASDNNNLIPRSESTGFIFPYGSNPLPLGKLEDRNCYSPLDGVMSKPDRKFHSAPGSFLSHKIHGGGSVLDNSDDKFGTCQSSGRSSCKGAWPKSNYDHGDSHTERPYHPDWGSSVWYQARCFDHYWSHYNFVMDWYHQHIKAVQSLQHQPWASFQPGPSYSSRKKRSEAARRRRHCKNIRKRKKAKEAFLKRNKDSQSTSDSSDRNKTSNGDGTNGNSEEDDDLEMEITDEMAQFIKISMMHKMERDNMKKTTGIGENKEDADLDNGQPNPSTAAPTERPGTRRAAELKDLYGAGAAMIHGMETALQMTYDRHLDRFKPKPWPNMPLKIVFS